MKRILTGALITTTLLTVPGIAAANQISQGVGIDLIRWANPKQEKMANIYYQRHWGTASDWRISYARSTNEDDYNGNYNDFTIYSASFIAYRSAQREGVYGEAGVIHYDDDYMRTNLDSDGETGVLLAVGHEFRISQNLTSAFAVRAIAGVPHNRGNEDSDTLFFEPSFTLAFKF